MISRVESFTPVLSTEILDSCNFFELYPFDGGGAFVNRDLLGSVDDKLITKAILHDGALDAYGSLEEIDFLKFDRWSTIEQACWINRMYFIVPLARQAKLTGDRELAEYLKRVIFRFQKLYPPPADEAAVRELNRSVLEALERDYNSCNANFDAPICYQWFDFQPASRLLHILYAVWFIKELGVFNAADYQQLDQMIAEHARVIYQASDFDAMPRKGNHDFLRSLALFTAGTLFTDLPQAEKWRLKGFRYCEYHVLDDFLPDGMAYDKSPSYHFFESWIARDFALRAAAANMPLCDEAQKRLDKAYEICRLLQLPDGMTPVISDGYPLDMSVFMRTLPGNSISAGEILTILPDAAMALRKNSGDFAFFDCSRCLSKFAHYHAGKQAITLWFNGKPFVEEGGCCNYDDPAFAEFFKTADAHATLLINDKGDSELQGRYCWLSSGEPELGVWKNHTVESTMTAPQWGETTWNRQLTITDGKAEIIDRISHNGNKKWTLLFPLAPEVTIKNSGGKLLLCNGDVSVELSSTAAVNSIGSRCVRNFRIVPTSCLVLSGQGDAVIKSIFQKTSTP